MPLYDHDCPACGNFAVLRSVARRDDPALCPSCGAAAPRVRVSAPGLERLSPAVRQAHAVNERSRHEPTSSQALRARHGAGCGCCHGGSSAGRGQDGKAGVKSFAGRRPWMISH